MSELSKKARNRTRVQMVLTMLVIVSIIRQFFLGNYHNMFLGILTLILFMVPQFIDKKLGVTIPVGLETVILIFIFSAEILGEINAFYVKIPVWDTILHTTNGFLMAAIGFALIDLFNRSDRFSIKMSPYFVAFFAFCFSMTVGVLWEFTGEGAKTLSISDRIALCNMAVEAGAKTGIFEADEKAMEYLKEHGREPKAVFHSDPDAHYIREYTIDLSKVEPVVAKPDFVDNLSPAKEVRGIKIDEAFLGSCNNGRIEDLRVGAEVIKGKKVADKVRFLVVPASQTIYRQALKEGLLDIFMEAGAIVMNPNCSVCWGSCQGVIGENEVLISTGTRNFKGRAGHPSSKVYLGSAATVTASAIKGEIALASDL